MQHTHHLNPVPVRTIDDGVRVFTDYFMAGPFTHAFGPDQRILPNAFRGSPDRCDHPIGGGEAELSIVRFDVGDIPYRSR